MSSPVRYGGCCRDRGALHVVGCEVGWMHDPRMDDVAAEMAWATAAGLLKADSVRYQDLNLLFSLFVFAATLLPSSVNYLKQDIIAISREYYSHHTYRHDDVINRS